MRFPYHLLNASTVRSEPWLAAMAAVAIGMFAGAWLIGPAITRHNSDVPPQAAQERTSFEDMISRPTRRPIAPRPRPSTSTARPTTPPLRRKRPRPNSAASPVTTRRPPRRAAYPRSRGNYPAFDRHRVY